MSSPSILSVNRNWHFVIKPLYSFIMLLGIVICFTAAYWQYQKSVFYQAPVAQTLHMQGTFLNEYSHFLDNQTLEGQVGYSVITPFQYDGEVYLVNRGFIQYKSRDQLPIIEKVTAKVVIDGRLLSNHKPLLLNDSLQDPVDHRIQFIDEKYFSMLLGRPVNHKVFVQESGEGLLQAKPIKSTYLSHHRHQAYALQWLLLGFCGVTILVLSSLKRGSIDG